MNPHSKPQKQSWSLDLLTVKGIPIRIHTTFFILLLWVAYAEISQGGSAAAEILFVLVVFLCVALHELGHALMASVFKIGTRDITLYPFGGIAMLLGNPAPKPELLIAIAGPAVNVAIAAALYPFLTSAPGEEWYEISSLINRTFLTNVALVIFNMIPAFPMDGGRVLRALLAILKVKKALLISARISQLLSITFIGLGLYWGHIILVLVGVVIFSQASREIFSVKAKSAFTGRTVRDVMIPGAKIASFEHSLSVREALTGAVRSFQEVFPVVHGEDVLGVVTKEALFAAEADGHGDDYIGSHALRLAEDPIPVASQNEPLPSLLERLSGTPLRTLLVLDDKKLAGLLTKETLLEYLLLHEITSRDKEAEAL